jgi:hypothetical protein
VVGTVVLAAGLSVIVGSLATQILGGAAGAEADLVTHLKQVERDGLEHRWPWGELKSQALQFQRISVSFDVDGTAAEVNSTLDFTGVFTRSPSATPTRVSSLGLERSRYVFQSGDWKPQSFDAERMGKILEALESRRLAVERGSPASRWAGVEQRVYRVEAWFIRSERDTVSVAEDYRFQGVLPDRPVDEKGTLRLELKESPEGLFSFLPETR